jgi:hypothetical protein
MQDWVGFLWGRGFEICNGFLKAQVAYNPGFHRDLAPQEKPQRAGQRTQRPHNGQIKHPKKRVF